jgi:maleate isomerase
MAPNGISIHAARVPFGAYKSGGTMDRTIADDPVRAFADPPLVDDAAELLASQLDPHFHRFLPIIDRF